MKTLRKLDRTGDTAVVFDETEATAEQRSEAKRIFDDWMAGKGKGAAYLTKRQNGQPDMKLTSFDQIEDGAEALLFPAIVAG